MEVKIEVVKNVYIDLEFTLPFLGHVCLEWYDHSKMSYAVSDIKTGRFLKTNLSSYSEAEHWALEEDHKITENLDMEGNP